MSELTLRFTSPCLAITCDDSSAFVGTFAGWTIRDSYDPSGDAIDRNVGRYELLMERELTTDDDAFGWYYEGIDLLDKIERLWPYVVGVPFGGGGFGPGFAQVQPPRGWHTNVEAVDMAIKTATTGVIMRLVDVSRPQLHLPRLPADAVTTALARVGTLSDVEQELVEIHFAAHKAPSEQATVVLFAKALEIVRALLPGSNDAARQRALPADVQESLAQPLHAIYDRSNNRRETRHPIVAKPIPQLHPRMTGAELSAYLTDADNLIRYLVSQTLGLELVLLTHSL